MFSVPENNDLHPVHYYRRSLQLPEHEHLKTGEPVVDFLLRHKELVKAGRVVLGTVYMPRVQGELRPLFEWMLENLLGRIPDYLVVLDAEFWTTSPDRTREILMFHEMLHMAQAVDQYGEPRFNRQTGEPIWAIRGHDIEEFNEVVARYGAWAPDVKRFLEAARQGGAF